MTTLERLNEKKEEIKTQLQLCEFACKIQNLLDNMNEIDGKLAEIKGEENPDLWLKTYDELQNVRTQIKKVFTKASKIFEISFEKKNSVWDMFRAWNHFCCIHNHWDFYLNF